MIKKINWAEFVDNIINDDNKILPTSLTSVIILNTKMQKRQGWKFRSWQGTGTNM
jgi:hypothetical protein